MQYRMRLVHVTVGLMSLGCAGAAIASSGVPALDEADRSFDDRRHGALQLLERGLERGLFRQPNETFAFSHYADLFLADDDSLTPGGLAPNVAAAVFSNGEPAEMTFSGGGASGQPVFGPQANGNNLGAPGGMSSTIGPVPNALPGGSGGGASGGGGGGGGGNGNSGTDEMLITIQHLYPQGGGNGDIIRFSDQHGNGSSSPNCFCCFDGNLADKGDSANGGSIGGGTGEVRPDGGPTPTAIPVPAPLWIGLIGLAAVGWMRRHRAVV